MRNYSTAPVIAGLAVGVGFVLLIVFAIEQRPSTDRPLVTITGEVVCLPHKKGLFNGFETSECAAGFYGKDDGRYYGLNATYDDKIAWLFHAEGSKEFFNVTGSLRPDPDSIYDIAYFIDIVSVNTADGSTSIYEVFSRHFGELIDILDGIQNETGGGYSMGIERGCNDIANIDDDRRKSCILIALEKDVPELSNKIPKELEGYPVYVVRQPPLSSPIPTVPVEEAKEINFGVALERDLIVKKGETVRVPVTIETLGTLEIVLDLSVMPYTFDREAPDAGELALSLDKESVVLSKDNIAEGKARVGDNIIIGYGWVITDAGFLTITASPTATLGTYEYIVEANYTHMGSGQLITVTVTD